jgi:uncharacterized protein YdhG (YjbR/CyaY superfamily)
MAGKPTTVDEYVAALPDDARQVVEGIRATIRDTVPGVGERISYGMPTFLLDGQPLVHVAAWKRHVALYPLPQTVDDADLERDVAPYRARDAKDTMRLPLGQPPPLDLVARLVGELVRLRGA